MNAEDIQPAAIQAYRTSRGLSRADLADLCSVSPAAVANWELGRNAPHGAAAAKLVSLMKGEISVIPLTPHEERMLDELVERHHHHTREEYLTAELIEAIKNPPALPVKKPALVRYVDAAKPKETLRAAEEARPEQRWGGKKKSAG